MYSTVLSIALFGASAWAQSSTSSASGPSSSGAAASASASASGSGTSGSSTGTSTVTGTVPAVGAVSNGPAELAASYCLPSSWSGPATDTPCYSMEVLNQACFYGPSVIETATATPSSTASPSDQQSCYCNQQTGVGFMYWEFMQGCGTCFRDHGSDGGPGAYNPDFITSLSSAYCGQATPSVAFGKFLTSFAGSTAVATKDLATSTVLGTQTDVSLYFTTIPTGGAALNATSANSTASATGKSNSTSVLTSSVLARTTSAGSSSAGAGGSSTASASSTQSSSGASAVQLSGFFGAMVIGFAAML